MKGLYFVLSVLLCHGCQVVKSHPTNSINSTTSTDNLNTQKPCPIRPTLYAPTDKGKGYYSMYSQGPCKNDEWFAVNVSSKGDGVCQKNPCLKNLKLVKEPEFIFVKNGKCYETKSQAYCPPNQVAYFTSESDFEPNCHPSKEPTDCVVNNVSYSIAVAPNIPCPSGTKEDAGNCVDVATF